MHSESSLDGAIKLAHHSRLPQVAERIGVMRLEFTRKQQKLADDLLLSETRERHGPIESRPANRGSDRAVENPQQRVETNTTLLSRIVQKEVEPSADQNLVPAGPPPVDRKLRKPAVNPFAVEKKANEDQAATCSDDVFAALRKVTENDDKCILRA